MWVDIGWETTTRNAGGCGEAGTESDSGIDSEWDSRNRPDREHDKRPATLSSSSSCYHWGGGVGRCARRFESVEPNDTRPLAVPSRVLSGEHVESQ
jgi:hypothetical protein